MSATCRLCCKSRKLQGSDFFAKTRNGKQSTIRIISIALPKSHVSFTRGDEVPHIFTRKPRLQPAEFLITSAKRLLQHNLPGADIAPPSAQTGSPHILKFDHLPIGAAMQLPRRDFLHLAAGAAALPAVSRVARAQAYPARPVRVVVPVAAGGANDVTGASDRPMAVGAPRPAVLHREPSGRRHQCRHRGGHSGTRRRLHAAHFRQQCGDQPDPVPNAQLQFHPRHRADREHRPRAPAHAGESVAAGEKRSRVHRLCQGQSRQDRDGLRRQRLTGACHRGIFQADDRHRSHACPLSRCGARGDRSARRANPGGVHRNGDVARARQVRQAARPGGDDRRTHGGAAGRSDARASSFRVSRRASGSGSLRPRTRRRRSSRSSTPRSTPRLPIPR